MSAAIVQETRALHVICMDAALQKNFDIKRLLTSCAELLTGSSAGALQTTAQAKGTEQNLPPKVATDATELNFPAPESKPCSLSDDTNALRDGSEKLAHYIVRLESELGHYKNICDNNSVQETRPHLTVAPAGSQSTSREDTVHDQNVTCNGKFF